MKTRLQSCAFAKTAAFALVCAMHLAADPLDLAPSARRTAWVKGDEHAIASWQDSKAESSVGLVWDEERDIREVRVQYDGAAFPAQSVEYWFKNWPYDRPKMPSIEDPMDDPWQGRWLPASVSSSCHENECRYTFNPLSINENPRANRLPGTTYRRTLKIRLVYGNSHPAITGLQAFSGTQEAIRRMEVELPSANQMEGEIRGQISVYNGRLQSLRGAGFDAEDHLEQDGQFRFRTGLATKRLRLDVIGAQPDLPGSNDGTVITVHASHSTGRNLSFSFDPVDLEQGPIVIPALGVRVTNPDPVNAATLPSKKEKVRARLAREEDQTYERASQEIPALDPWNREWAGPLYLPLAADASWQKFAFQIGGNVYLSKKGMKAKPTELARLGWKDDRLTWKIGTGEYRSYREDHKVKFHPAERYLPIGVQTWTQDGIEFKEEAFATLLHGPLAPDDPQRNEQTPAMLLLRLTATNSGTASKRAVVWLSTETSGEDAKGKAEQLQLQGSHLMAGPQLRGVVEAPPQASLTVSSGSTPAVRVAFDLSPGSAIVTLKLPAVTDLAGQDIQEMEQLSYPREREKVASYWRELVRKADRFQVPEARFNNFLRATVIHIHITANKDPQTGLVMLPAASYAYDVYENESCYQLLLLDALGQAKTAETYLEPMIKLQGSKNFPGVHRGAFDGVFHGVKISDEVDYTASGYGLDVGTVLWTLAQHYLYTHDQRWFEKAWPHMQKAIAWIVEQRQTTKRSDIQGERVREYGLLPASQLEDNSDWAHWFSINAFAWAGMDLTAQALADLKRPEAEAIRSEAAAYKTDLRNAVLRATALAPVTRLQDGTYQPYVPTVPTRRFRLFGPTQMNYYARYGDSNLKPLLRLGADRDTLCGTVLLLILGVFDPQEPIADWILNDWEDNETLTSGMGMNVHGLTDDKKWFSQGGMVFQANLINPIPVYLKRHEAGAAIRNLYNDFVGCLYPEANAFTEEFHQWIQGSGPFYKSPDEARFVNRLRDTLVLEDRDTLWLAPGVPRRWTASAEGVQVANSQTFFGPVSYSMRAGAKAGTVEAQVQLPTRNPAKKSWLIVRTPSGKMRSVKLNGKTWTRINPAIEGIELPAGGSKLSVQVEY